MIRLRHLAIATLFAFPTLAIGAQESKPPDPRFGEWTTIFDGSSFEGWEVSKPVNAAFNWAIEDGAMTNRADPAKPAHNIATSRKFHNFEARLEFKVSEGDGNAGVYLRGRAEIQIFNSHGKDELGDADMGAIYRYAPPLADATRPAGEWNTLDIRFVGARLDVTLNGQLIQNNAYIPHKTGQGRADDFDSPGIFELQGDHDKVWFRNIRIRPLFEDDGWRPLILGGGADGWKPLRGGDQKWAVEEGALTNAGAPIHDLITEELFGDFLVRYEYKSEGNSGFYLRNLWEIQIQTSHGLPTTRNSDGALYSYYPPRVNASKPEGEWSVVEAKVIGRKITVHLNGVMIHDEAECPARTYDNSNTEGLDDPGPFLLQGDHGRVWFANIWVKRLNQ